MRPGFLFIFLLLSSCLFLQPAPLDRPVFVWPLKSYSLTQKFSVLKRPPHLGIDLKAPLGTPVLSAHSGYIVYAGRGLSGYGNVVMLERSPRWASLYAHLQTIHVKEGRKVKAGDLLGTVGQTGRATGSHLHFELIYNKQPINPLLYLP